MTSTRRAGCLLSANITWPATVPVAAGIGGDACWLASKPRKNILKVTSALLTMLALTARIAEIDRTNRAILGSDRRSRKVAFATSSVKFPITPFCRS